MKDMFKITKMLQEARDTGKKRSPVAELFSVIAVFVISGYIQIFTLVIGCLYYFASDETVKQLISQNVVDTTKLFERLIQLIKIAPEWLNILTIFTSVFGFFAAIFLCKKIDKRKISSIGFRKGYIFREYFVGAIIGAVMISLVAALGIIIKAFEFNGFNGISVPVFIAYLIGFAINGFAEEALIRGYYLSSMAKTSSPLYAIVLGSVLYMFFTVFSYGFNFILMFNTILIGLFSGFYVLKRGNLWGVCAFNFSWNFCQMIVFGFNFTGKTSNSSILNISTVKGFDSLNGGIFGITAGLIVTLIVFLAVGVVLKIKYNQNELAEVKEEINE